MVMYSKNQANLQSIIDPLSLNFAHLKTPTLITVAPFNLELHKSVRLHP